MSNQESGETCPAHGQGLAGPDRRSVAPCPGPGPDEAGSEDIAALVVQREIQTFGLLILGHA